MVCQFLLLHLLYDRHPVRARGVHTNQLDIDAGNDHRVLRGKGYEMILRLIYTVYPYLN